MPHAAGNQPIASPHMSSSLTPPLPDTQFAAIVQDDSQIAWRHLANTLEIYDYLLQHSAHIDIANMPHAVESIVGNVTSSSKPEVRNIFHCRQRRTEPRLVRVGRVILDTRERPDRQIDKQTYKHVQRSISHPTGEGEVIVTSIWLHALRFSTKPSCRNVARSRKCDGESAKSSGRTCLSCHPRDVV